MPRSRRRRQNDRRREAEQRRIAQEAIERAKHEPVLGRYERAITRAKAGEIIEAPAGKLAVQNDGSMKKIRDVSDLAQES